MPQHAFVATTPQSTRQRNRAIIAPLSTDCYSSAITHNADYAYRIRNASTTHCAHSAQRHNAAADIAPQRHYATPATRQAIIHNAHDYAPRPLATAQQQHAASLRNAHGRQHIRAEQRATQYATHRFGFASSRRPPGPGRSAPASRPLCFQRLPFVPSTHRRQRTRRHYPGSNRALLLSPQQRCNNRTNAQTHATHIIISQQQRAQRAANATPQRTTQSSVRPPAAIATAARLTATWRVGAFPLHRSAHRIPSRSRLSSRSLRWHVFGDLDHLPGRPGWALAWVWARLGLARPPPAHLPPAIALASPALPPGVTGLRVGRPLIFRASPLASSWHSAFRLRHFQLIRTFAPAQPASTADRALVQLRRDILASPHYIAPITHHLLITGPFPGSPRRARPFVYRRHATTDQSTARSTPASPPTAWHHRQHRPVGRLIARTVQHHHRHRSRATGSHTFRISQSVLSVCNNALSAQPQPPPRLTTNAQPGYATAPDVASAVDRRRLRFHPATGRRHATPTPGAPAVNGAINTPDRHIAHNASSSSRRRQPQQPPVAIAAAAAAAAVQHASRRRRRRSSSRFGRRRRFAQSVRSRSHQSAATPPPPTTQQHRHSSRSSSSEPLCLHSAAAATAIDIAQHCYSAI